MSAQSQYMLHYTMDRPKSQVQNNLTVEKFQNFYYFALQLIVK